MPNFRFESDLFGHRSPVIKEFPVAATQTLVAGDLVYLSSGQVTIAGASTASVLGIMAEDSASADENTMVAVALAAPGFMYRATADADASSALTAKTYDINATTQTVDVGDTSNGCIKIIETVDSNTDIRIVFTEFDLGPVN
jgi:hypothetical protein